MKIVVAFGGLGNVMFYYALATAFRLKGVKSFVFISRTNLEHNCRSIKDIFPNLSIDNDLNRIQKLYYSLLEKIRDVHFKKYKIPHRLLCYPFESLIVDNPVNYDPDVFSDLDKNHYLIGYFQTYRYFEDCSDIVRKEFQFSDQAQSDLTKEMAKYISSCASVSIHVRRGDYQNGYYYDMLGKVCGIDYYKRAIDLMKSKIANPHFFVFSDDSGYVKQNLWLENVTYVDFNSGGDSWQDMYMMTKCKHNIIANSTFSWWGAWLNDNKEKIVIAPSRWFADREDDEIIPNSWLRI